MIESNFLIDVFGIQYCQTEMTVPRIEINGNSNFKIGIITLLMMITKHSNHLSYMEVVALKNILKCLWPHFL